MREDLDKLLCEKYPKIFVNRHKSMQETCMCWGFECGDGWFNILNTACGIIQSHIDWSRKQRCNALKFNRALRNAIAGDKESLIKYYTYAGGEVTDWVLNRVESDLASKSFRPVPDKISQVVADQVKEKFGTLRFYVHGGNQYTNGVVSMAEAMSASTCEICGSPGKIRGGGIRGGGWIYTACDEHTKPEHLETNNDV